MNSRRRKRKPPDGLCGTHRCLKKRHQPGSSVSKAGRRGRGQGAQVPLRPWEGHAEAWLHLSHSLRIRQPQLRDPGSPCTSAESRLSCKQAALGMMDGAPVGRDCSTTEPQVRPRAFFLFRMQPDPGSSFFWYA